jgi:hypothetical protein
MDMDDFDVLDLLELIVCRRKTSVEDTAPRKIGYKIKKWSA